jgi:hypothetical protein
VSLRLISLTVAGFILGAFAAGGVGVSVIREVRALDDATSLPAENIARSDGYHVDPTETLISSVALVPTNATIDDRGLVLSYALSSIAPSLGVELSGTGQPLYPKRWLAEAIGGEFEGVVDNPTDTTVTFPLMAGGTLDQVDKITVIEAFIPAPFEKRVGLSSGVPTASVIPGLDVELVSESNDGDTSTIEIRFVTDPGAIPDVSIVGDGPGWRSTGVKDDTVTLTRDNDDSAVDSYRLVVSGTSWIPVDGEFTVDIGAVDE